MHSFADLRATADERVGIDHRSFVDISADVDEHRRHASDAAADVRAIANGRTAGHDANPIRELEQLAREGVLIEERTHFNDAAVLESGQDALLHPGVHPPSAGRVGIGLGRANRAIIQPCLELAKQGV
jgi:hypothetical protein